jgi:hypothetical protein
MTLSTKSQAFAQNSEPVNLSIGIRIAARLTGTSLDELAVAPDDERKAVCVASLSLVLTSVMSILGWWAGLSIARASFTVAHLPWAVLAGLIVFTIDHAMLRRLWSNAGRNLAKDRGFPVKGRRELRFQFLHLLLRLCVTLIISLTLAGFLDIELFRQDTDRHLDNRVRELNRPQAEAAAKRIDAVIAERRADIARLDGRAAAILGSASQSGLVAQAATASQIEALTSERAAAQRRLSQVEREIDCFAQDVAAEEHGRTRCDGAKAEKGIGDAYKYAANMAETKRKERAALGARIAEIDAALPGLRSDVLGSGVSQEAKVQLNQIAAERVRTKVDLDGLVERRDEAIRDSLRADSDFVPQSEGLIAHGEALEELAAASSWLWRQIYLVLLCIVILDLGTVLVMTTMQVPQTVALGEFMTAEVRMYKTLARGEGAIAEVMEALTEARVRRTSAENMADEKIARLRSDMTMRRAANEHIDAHLDTMSRRAG